MSFKQALTDGFARMLAQVISLGGARLGNLLTDPRYFTLWEAAGVHITPVHYYQPIPDTRTLPADLWQRRSSMVGVDINESFQLELLNRFRERFQGEYRSFPVEPTPVPHKYYLKNRSFESVDAQILYCIIRHFRPSRVFEVGSGNSTFLAAEAILRNAAVHQHDCELIACDPHPWPVFEQGFPGLTRLIASNIEDVPLSEFARLKENDILFLDSTHVLRIGGDVQHEYLEILPRLNKGVFVHVHDVFLPEEYPFEYVVNRRLFWTEQYLLQAFLAFNDSFRVVWAGRYMHLQHPGMLKAAFPSYDPQTSWPASMWIQKIREP